MDSMPAPFLRRLAARGIDAVVAVPVAFIACLPAGVLAVLLQLVVSDDAATSIGAGLAVFLSVAAIEYFLLRRRGGQTLGKGLLGLKVVPADGSSDRVSARAALTRMSILVGPLIGGLVAYLARGESERDTPGGADEIFYALWFAVLSVCALTALLDRAHHRGAHDRAAGTRVVCAPRRGVKIAEDVRMLLPGKVSFKKTPVPAPPSILSLRKT